MFYIYTLSSVLLVSIVSLVGVFGLSLKQDVLKKYVFIFVSLAVGALLGDAFIHLIPEAIEEIGNIDLIAVLVIIGVFLFFILEKFIHWHHHGSDIEENHIHPVGKMILFSDGLHNFMDGVIIAASYMISIEIGIATTIAVILHEIPQEIGDFGVLIHAGYSKTKALFLNFVSALFSVLGAITVFFLGEFADSAIKWFIPLAAGGFIYIAIADLIPELHKEKNKFYSVIQVFVAGIGVLLMYALLFLE
jgi:zinc and cadmium transporter